MTAVRAILLAAALAVFTMVALWAAGAPVQTIHGDEAGPALVHQTTGISVPTYGVVVRVDGCTVNPCVPIQCQEDMACWDCETMGNKVCGP